MPLYKISWGERGRFPNTRFYFYGEKVNAYKFSPMHTFICIGTYINTNSTYFWVGGK